MKSLCLAHLGATGSFELLPILRIDRMRGGTGQGRDDQGGESSMFHEIDLGSKGLGRFYAEKCWLTLGYYPKQQVEFLNILVKLIHRVGGWYVGCFLDTSYTPGKGSLAGGHRLRWMGVLTHREPTSENTDDKHGYLGDWIFA